MKAVNRHSVILGAYSLQRRIESIVSFEFNPHQQPRQYPEEVSFNPYPYTVVECVYARQKWWGVIFSPTMQNNANPHDKRFCL